MTLARTHEMQYGVGVPKGEVARSAAEAETIAKSIGMCWLFDGFSPKQTIDGLYRWR